VSDAERGRLGIDPGQLQAPKATVSRTGAFPVAGLDESLGLVYVPAQVDGALRLVVLLHGAGGSAQQGLDLLRAQADAHHLLLVAPQSVGATWDVISGGYGPDVRRIGRLVERVVAGYPVRALAIGGFSDGASYAMSLGIGNGDLFEAVVAFSPGFMAPLEQRGKPRIFVSHGAHDRVLPIDRCSRRLVPQLQRAGYDVVYQEFDGGHVVPADIVDQATRWLLQRQT
jgi:predicted esterase